MHLHQRTLLALTLLFASLAACSSSPSPPSAQSLSDAGAGTCEAACAFVPTGPCEAYHVSCGGPGPYMTAIAPGCPAECLQLYCNGRQELAPAELGGEVTCSTNTPELPPEETVWCCVP